MTMSWKMMNLMRKGLRDGRAEMWLPATDALKCGRLYPSLHCRNYASAPAVIFLLGMLFVPERFLYLWLLADTRPRWVGEVLGVNSKNLLLLPTRATMLEWQTQVNGNVCNRGHGTFGEISRSIDPPPCKHCSTHVKRFCEDKNGYAQELRLDTGCSS